MKKIALPFFCIFVALVFCFHPARSSSPPVAKSASGDTLTFDVSHFGGAGSEAVLVEGNYAYIGVGSDFTIIDVSDPSRPVRIGSLTVSDTYKLLDIVKKGSNVFVVGWDGLHIIDVTDVTYPIQVGSYLVIGQGSALCVALSGNYAFLGYGFKSARA